MHNGSHVSLNAEAYDPNCVFCHRSNITFNILKETRSFILITDHAPLLEGHILIIPKTHYACYGTVPHELDAELFALKHEVQQFFAQYYAPAIFWEHGIFRQTVFHAHLHCFPFGNTEYDPAEQLHNRIVCSQDDIRAWYASQGQYFYMEDATDALLFAPDIDRYMHIIKDVLWHGVATHTRQKHWRSQQQRQAEGGPLIAATKNKWREFQQQGATYADETSA
jgi:diadenosine tetraphosphate (Ap4A) HIT family hydrolase